MMRAPQDAWEEQPLTPGQLEALLPYGRELKMQPGDYLFDENSVVDSFYVLLEGEVEISRLDGEEEISIGTHRAGEFTGGLAVLTGRTSIHRARAGEPSRVLEVDSETFRRVAVELPEVADVFISGLAGRWRKPRGATRKKRNPAALGRPSAGWPTSSTTPRQRRGGPPTRL